MAYAGLADAYLWLGMDYMRPRDTMPKAEAAAVKALELDENLTQAHASLGMIKYRFNWDWASESEFRRAIEVDSKDASAHHKYGWYLAMVGRLDESRDQMKMAAQLDPLTPGISGDLGLPLYCGRRYDDANAIARKVLDNNPGSYVIRYDLGLGLEQSGR